MKNIILASFALFALAGCSKQPAEVTPTGEGVELVITPTMAGSVAATKALVPNDKFIHDAKVGFTILNSTAPNTGAAHLSGYYNIMARGASNINATSVVDKWTYYVNGLYMGRALAGVPLQNSTIDVYGYYPYNPEMTDITAVPFSIATTVGAVTTATEEQATTDYMWATPKTNYQIQDGRDDLAYPLPISMNFNHLMTCLEFRIRKAYYGPELNSKQVIKWLKFIEMGRGYARSSRPS